MATGEAIRPLVAGAHALHWTAPFGWLRAGWHDLRAAAGTSLGYGLVMVGISWLIALAAWRLGNLGFYLGLLSGFVFLGPLLALTLYAVSARLACGAPVSLRRTIGDARSALGDALVFAVILLVVFLIWARAAAMIHVFFPLGAAPSLSAWLRFLGIGSAIGAMFCAIIFMAGAFSLPMMLDRQTDTVTAVLSSIHATLRNKPAMLVWAGVIGLFVVVGVLTAFLAYAVLLPWLGHAVWHGYRETLDVAAWPPRPLL